MKLLINVLYTITEQIHLHARTHAHPHAHAHAKIAHALSLSCTHTYAHTHRHARTHAQSQAKRERSHRIDEFHILCLSTMLQKKKKKAKSRSQESLVYFRSSLFRFHFVKLADDRIAQTHIAANTKQEKRKLSPLPVPLCVTFQSRFYGKNINVQLLVLAVDVLRTKVSFDHAYLCHRWR